MIGVPYALLFGMVAGLLQVDAAPSELTYDLAVDASGAGEPSAVAAGLAPGRAVTTTPVGQNRWPWTAGAGVAAVAALSAMGGAASVALRRRHRVS